VEVKRFIIAVHRWLGVALCLLFLVWFVSGIGMMYWDFPSVTPADRLERSPRVNASAIALSPSDAYAKIGGSKTPSAIRLNTFDRRPVYRFRIGRDEALVYADTGEAQRMISREMVDRIAAAWTGQPSSQARVEPMRSADQWTVQGPLRTLRPLWKFSWPNGEQAYVAQSSGEVVQYTTTRSRLGAYLGPIPHWLYFTPLRVHQQAWSRTVIWASGIGTVATLLGIVVAVWTYSPSKRYRLAGAPARLPYRGQKRWHAVIGLIVGVTAATWAFSGMLSMDPFGDGGRPPTLPLLTPTLDVAAFATKHPRTALEQLGDLDVRELELASFGGESVYIATLARGDTRIVPTQGDPRPEFDRQRIAEIVAAMTQAKGGAELRVIDQYDRYYLDRRRTRPLPVLVAQLNDPDATRYYIDPKTARVVGSYSARAWTTRWLYHGLHSLDFPWLYNHRPAWDIVVIALMLAGTALSVTSIVLAWRVVRSRHG
jgi:PepSY-associated transmembrane protein